MRIPRFLFFFNAPSLAKLKLFRSATPILLVVLISCTVCAAHVRFASGSRALGIPFELEDNLIYVPVSINGSQPLSFILDTGAYTIVDLKRAQELGAKLKHIRESGGIGDEPQKVYLGEQKVSFGLPGVTLDNQRLLAVSLKNVEECVNVFVVNEEGRDVAAVHALPKSITRRVDGILGAELFKEVVVEIDYDARRLNIYEPHDYKYVGDGEKYKLEITPQHIFMKAQVLVGNSPPLTGRFMLDTGGAMALTLTKQFTDEHKLLPPAEQLTAHPICGLNGMMEVKSLIGTIEGLQLGRVQISHPVVEFRRAADYDFDGFIGGAVFRKYKMIFDYSRKLMIMEWPRIP